MIELKITIPNDEAHNPNALSGRLAVLGFYRPEPVQGVALVKTDVPAQVPAWEAMSRKIDKSLTEFNATYPAEAMPAGDEAIIEAVAKAVPKPKPEPKKHGRPAKTEPAPNISTQPEARVDPEVEAQDEADEAAEVAATAPANEVVTPETLRAEMGAYAQKFGMDAALADGTAIFTDALGPAPDGGWKLSVVAGTGGETLAKAVVAWRAAAAGGARYGG